MDSTPVESRRNTSIAPLPMSLDSTLMELLASPLSAERHSLLSPLFIYLKRIVHRHLFILGRKRDPELLRDGEVVPLEKQIKTSHLGFLF